MNPIKRIFIIGHSGAGKALLGKTLADKIGWQFIDADFGLEIKIGRTIHEIVGKEGGKSLYHCEWEMLNSFLTQESIVVTTDASIVYHEQNRNILSSEFTVYLKVSIPIQLERTLRNPEPFLLVGDLKDFFEKLHAERDDLYDQVTSLSIDGDHNALDEHVAIILKKLNFNMDKQSSDSLVLEKKDLIFYHKTAHMPVNLTEQQALCLKLLAQGKSSKEIAKILNISYRTVEGYIAKTAEILGCVSSKELIALYHDRH